MQRYYPDHVEHFEGQVMLKLPLTFVAIQALLVNIMIDTDLPRDSKKRKREFDASVEEAIRVRAAITARSREHDEHDAAEGDIMPEIPVERVDDTINKANSITVSKTTVGGFKSALKLHYADRRIDFTCIERPAGNQDITT